MPPGVRGEALKSAPLPALFVPGGSPTPTHVSPPLPPLCPPQGVYRVEALSPSHPWSRGVSLFPRQAPHMAVEVTRGVQVRACWYRLGAEVGLPYMHGLGGEGSTCHECIHGRLSGRGGGSDLRAWAEWEGGGGLTCVHGLSGKGGRGCA